MEHLLEKSKCFIFHNVFQLNDISKVSKCVLWSKGLLKLVTQIKGIFVCFGASYPSEQWSLWDGQFTNHTKFFLGKLESFTSTSCIYFCL